MKKALYPSILGGVLAACAMAAQAEVVQVVLDVAPQSRTIEQWLPGSLDKTVDTSFQPQAFQWVVSFDLDRAVIDGAQTYPEVSSMQAGIWFQGATTSTTPYTASFNSVLPLPDAPMVSNGVKVGAWLSKSIDKPPLYLPHTLGVTVDINDGTAWRTSESEGRIESRGYGRGVSFLEDGPVTSNGDFHAWTANEFVAYLQSQIGKTKLNRFSESASYEVLQRDPAPGTVVGATFEGPLTAMASVYILGDVTIRSVTAIPEPSSWLSMSLGLGALVGLMRQRSRRQVSGSV